MEPGSPALQADSLPAEPQGKPKSTGVGSLSLLQQIFPTQESNWNLKILYSHQQPLSKHVSDPEQSFIEGAFGKIPIGLNFKTSPSGNAYKP